MTRKSRAKPPRKVRVSPHRRDLETYCDSVLDGKIKTGHLEFAAVQRYRYDCDSAGSRGMYWDDDEFELTIKFIELLKHSTGEFEGTQFLLQPWQKFVAGNIFAWKLRDDGFRRFREAFVSMGRGNGKSPFMAALTNRTAILDGESRYQFQIAAVERAQAEIVFNEVCEQLQSQPAFQGRFDFYRPKHGKKSIVDLALNGVIEPLGSEGRDGYNLLGFVADEIHAWRAEHQDLWEKLQTSMSKRRQPLGLTITTAGDDMSKLWLSVHGFSASVATMLFDEPRHFSFICEIDEADRKASLYDEDLWRKGNPNLDISVKRAGLRLYANKAKNDLVIFNQWLRYHMNIRVRSVLKVIIQSIWDDCDEPLPDLAGKPCHGGLDMGWRNDLASFYLCFPLPNRRYALKGWNWLPKHGGREISKNPWLTWIDQQLITLNEGTDTDPDAIYERVHHADKTYSINSIGLDPANARAIGMHLVKASKFKVFDFGQSAKNYNEPIREFLIALNEKRILHGNDPVLAWAANNLVLRTDYAGLVMPDKAHADEKIDPIVAALMAFARCLYGEEQGPGPRIRTL